MVYLLKKVYRNTEEKSTEQIIEDATQAQRQQHGNPENCSHPIESNSYTPIDENSPASSKKT